VGDFLGAKSEKVQQKLAREKGEEKKRKKQGTNPKKNAAGYNEVEFGAGQSSSRSQGPIRGKGSRRRKNLRGSGMGEMDQNMPPIKKKGKRGGTGARM